MDMECDTAPPSPPSPSLEDACCFLSGLNGIVLMDVLRHTVTKEHIRHLLSGWTVDDIVDVLPNTFNKKECARRWSDDEFFKLLPVGHRFNPTDAELVSEYLMRKIKGEELPRSRIHSVTLMEFGPEELAGRHEPAKENEWYFFTPRFKKSKGSLERPNRAAGDGYWRSSRGSLPVKHDGDIIGWRKTLVYYRGNFTKETNREDKTNWIMQEYRVKNSEVVGVGDGKSTQKPNREDKTKQEYKVKNSEGNGDRDRDRENILDDWVLCKIYQNASNASRP